MIFPPHRLAGADQRRRTLKLLERQKPQRVDMQYIVHENQYKRMGNEELKNMFSIKATNGDYSAWISAFCSRKYNSDFAREMSRSVCEYLKQYEQY